jgi:hypothetical protein
MDDEWRENRGGVTFFGYLQKFHRLSMHSIVSRQPSGMRNQLHSVPFFPALLFVQPNPKQISLQFLSAECLLKTI